MRLLPRLFFLRVIIFLLSAVFFANMARSLAAQSVVQIPPEWEKALSSLAVKIAAASRPGKTFSLEARNASSLSAAYVLPIRLTLAAHLASLGFKTTSRAPEDLQIQLTLSESEAGYVWVAEIQRGDDHEVVMVSADRDAIQKPNAMEPPLALQRRSIWRQDARILDFVFVPYAGADAVLMFVVLEPNRVVFYEQRNGGWGLSRAVAIPRSHPVPRDVRGQIDVLAGKAQLSDAECTGQFENPETITCAGTKATQDASSLLQPIVVQGRSVESYATLTPACGLASLTLITGRGDWTEPDFVQAYGVRNQAEVVSQQVALSGPVTELWRESDGKSARVVSRDLQTGEYEASIVSASCGD